MTAAVPWWRLIVQVPERLSEDVGALLVAEGAAGAFEDPAASDEDTVRLTATFAPETHEDDVRAAGAAALTSLGLSLEEATVAFETFTPGDEAHAWKQYFQPLALGKRLWVIPEWVDTPIPDGRLAVRVDPGMAFGTGQHATTTLCLTGLETMAPKFQGRSVLDMGCGSGILGIAALHLGADRVTAIDNDPLAVTAAVANAALNDVPDRFVARIEPLAPAESGFALVMANILASVLIELAPTLVRAPEIGGVLMLSGILEEQLAEVVDAFQSAARRAGRLLKQQKIEHEDGWCAPRWNVETAANASEMR